MSAATRLQRDLPCLRIDGTIKFRVVLRLARAERGLRRETEGRESPYGSCLLHRRDRVRADMTLVRHRIAEDRAFWSVENVPTHVYEQVRVEAWGHVWFESVPVPAPVEQQRKAA